MSTTTNVVISEGISFNYLIKGTLLAIFSGIISLFFLPALIGLVVGVALVLASSGVEINIQKKQYRRYVGIFGYKIGKWNDLIDTVSLNLRESTQQYTKRTFILPMIGGWGGEKITHKTYDVSVTNYLSEEIIINDFDEYNQAVECLRALEVVTDKKGVNNYAIDTAKIIERRKHQRRR